MRYIFNFENEQEYENYNFNDVLEHINDRVLTYLRNENTIKKENIYTYIDYLESSGTQYINTNYMAQGRTNIAFADITYIGYVGSGTYVPWFNCRVNDSTLTWRIIKNNNNANSVIMTWNTANGNGTFSVAANNRYKFLFFNNFTTSITTNNSSVSAPGITNKSGTENSSAKLTLFYTNSKTRFWTFVWVKGNDSPLNLVPVRKGNVGYMIDILTRKLYGNAGTGSFILGPDSDKSYDAEVEYIEGTGTQWIDTRYVPQGKDIRIEGKFTPKGYTTDYGAWWAACNPDASTCTIYQILSSFSDNLNTGLRIIFGKKSGTDNINVFTIDELINVTTEEGQVPYEFKISYDKILLSINNGAFVEYMTPDAEPTEIENTARLSLFRKYWSLSYAKGLFHYFKVYKRDKLVVDLIPVRIGTVGYMYDRISKVLLSNMGTGNFGVGPDI